jgi:hypothetical protein
MDTRAGFLSYKEASDDVLAAMPIAILPEGKAITTALIRNTKIVGK